MTEALEYMKRFSQEMGAIDYDVLLTSFIDELRLSEEGRESSLSYIPSYLSPAGRQRIPRRVAAVDAGGTNLRIAVLSAEEEQVPKIISVKKYPMPGRDRPLEAEEFFDTLAALMDTDAPDIGDVGVSFAYKGSITPEGDYIIDGMCKEVTVNGIEGKSLVKGLNDAFLRRGSAQRRIRTVNDTAACLMGCIPVKRLFEAGSAVGMVLGTGFNICYRKDDRTGDGTPPDIIITESGFFDRIPRGMIDIELDQNSAIPGDHIAEKMISGKYLSEIFNLLMDHAAQEGLTEDTGRAEDSAYLDALLRSGEDTFAAGLARQIVERSARIAAVCVAGSVIASMREGGCDALIAVEGSTVLRMYGFMDIFRGMLDRLLMEERGITYGIFSGDESVLTGTASAALM